MRHSYVVPKRWMVIYEYEVPGWETTQTMATMEIFPMLEPGIEPETS
jgi:hypothetical protein